MLYIDQPFGVGYSYTSITNGTVDLLTGVFSPLSEPNEVPELNLTTVQASMSTPDPTRVINNTETAAKMVWKFAQVWFQEYATPDLDGNSKPRANTHVRFSEYKTSSDEISIWGTSVGHEPSSHLDTCSFYLSRLLCD